MQFAITPMEAADVPWVAGLERAHQLEPWSEKAFQEELEKLHSLCFVAKVCTYPHGPCPESTGETGFSAAGLPATGAGYICAWLVLDEVQILNVTVARPYWGHGIGRALLIHTLHRGWARGCMRAVLEVRPSNGAAIGLYRSVGFEVVGERPGFYTEGGESALLMEMEKNP